MSSGSSNESVVRQFYDQWNNGEIDFADLVAEDMVNHQPEAEPEHGAHDSLRR